MALYDPFKPMSAIQNNGCNLHSKQRLQSSFKTTIAILSFKKIATFIQNNHCNVVCQGRVQNLQDHTVDFASFAPPKF